MKEKEPYKRIKQFLIAVALELLLFFVINCKNFQKSIDNTSLKWYYVNIAREQQQRKVKKVDIMKKAKFIKNWRMLSLTIPKDAEYIDVVTTDKFPLGSILIRFKNTRLYALLNNGAISSCNQEEAEKYVKEMK